MNKKLFLIPLVILGYLFFILGIAWLIVDEPWMLDKVANEERIGMTFEKLFSEDINKSLPGYLKQIYRFFGLWVSIIGLFIIGFSKHRFTEDKSIRNNLRLDGIDFKISIGFESGSRTRSVGIAKIKGI